MSTYFFDTSALVKRYITETGSTWVDSLISLSVNRIYISRLTETEVSAALTRRLRIHDASHALADFDQDLINFYTRSDITGTIIDQAITLTRTQHLRGCDAIQLAAALDLVQINPSLVFVCSDTELLIAAGAVGLATENPDLH